jgi:hypothetical protein
MFPPIGLIRIVSCGIGTNQKRSTPQIHQTYAYREGTSVTIEVSPEGR